MRLTIARKIALAVTTVVMLSIGTMAWVTNQNLKRGFIAYLSELEKQNLESLSKLLAEDYRRQGNFDRFKNNLRPMRDLLDQLHESGQQDDDHPRPPPRRRPPPRDWQSGSFAPPPAAPPPRNAPPEQRPPVDPMRFGQRISLIDKNGQALIGPPDAPGGTIVPITLDGQRIGTLRLAPLRQISNASGLDFVTAQIRQTVWLAVALILIAVIISVWLARHLLRPVNSLHRVTERLARGEFHARVSQISQDELGDLAKHINSMAKTLEKNEEQRTEMLADISHELRTPLTVIQGEIEALIDGIRAPGPAALESLHAEVIHLNKLVDDIRQLTLADTGGLHFLFQNLDPATLLREVTQRYQGRANTAGLTLDCQCPAQAMSIRADADRLMQVLGNLLENSIRYTNAGGRILCSLYQQGKFACISIEDSAPGVSADAHARLFDRLYRADHARSRAHGGSGLGLSICKALVEAHDGSIEAMPSEIGGLKILIRLPLA